MWCNTPFEDCFLRDLSFTDFFRRSATVKNDRLCAPTVLLGSIFFKMFFPVTSFFKYIFLMDHSDQWLLTGHFMTFSHIYT